jgi:uncharacterized protein YidB (DUF937 family)
MTTMIEIVQNLQTSCDEILGENELMVHVSASCPDCVDVYTPNGEHFVTLDKEEAQYEGIVINLNPKDYF